MLRNELMVTTVGVLGSCVSRDLFFSKFNPNYKKYFRVDLSFQRSSIISIMHEPITFNENDLLILPKNNTNQARMNFLKNNKKKTIINDLIKNPPNILILDNYFEVRMGVIILEDGGIITNNNWDLPYTNFYNKLKIKKILTVQNNMQEYFDLWKKSCDLFFDFLDNNCPNTRIILNSFKQCFNVMKEDGTIELNEEFRKNAKSVNKFLKKFDEYIISKSVDILPFEDNILLDEKHLWGLGPVHYENKYYENKLNKLKLFVKVNFMNNDLTLLNNELLRYKEENEKLMEELTVEKEKNIKTKEYLLILENNLASLNNLKNKYDSNIKLTHNLEMEINLIKKENTKLKEDNKSLCDDVVLLKDQNCKLKEDNKSLCDDVVLLKDRNNYFRSKNKNLKRELDTIVNSEHNSLFSFKKNRKV